MFDGGACQFVLKIREREIGLRVRGSCFTDPKAAFDVFVGDGNIF